VVDGHPTHSESLLYRLIYPSSRRKYYVIIIIIIIIISSVYKSDRLHENNRRGDLESILKAGNLSHIQGIPRTPNTMFRRASYSTNPNLAESSPQTHSYIPLSIHFKIITPYTRMPLLQSNFLLSYISIKFFYTIFVSHVCLATRDYELST
jgi:hypothetical protein